MSHGASDPPGPIGDDTHKNASTSGTPVFAVGRSPSPAAGGLHQSPARSPSMTLSGWLYGATAYGSTASRPRPFLPVSITKCVSARSPRIALEVGLEG